MVKVSIIVPIYNVEKYLDRCLERLINQTLKEIEIILVNDKSPDNSLIICNNYAQKDSRIKVINKEENEGLGFARNSGLNAATGEFVAFVDSDDYVDYNFYERLYEVANDVDIVYGSVKDVDATGNVIRVYNNPLDNDCFCEKEVNTVLYNMLGKYNKDIYFSAAVWRAIYRRDLIVRNKIQFCSEREFISEDYIFHLDIIPKCKKIRIVNSTYYYYCVNNASLTRKYNPQRFTKIKALYNEIIRKLGSLDLLSEEAVQRCNYTFAGNVRVCIKQETQKPLLHALKNIYTICQDALVRKIFSQNYFKTNRQKIFDFFVKRKMKTLLLIFSKI